VQELHRKSLRRLEGSPPSSCPRVTILIVDDAAEWRLQVREILETQTELRTVSEACDELQAIQSVQELNPNLVLIDIGMPVLNGLKAAKQIQRIAPESKIVFLTQDSDADIRRSAPAAGARKANAVCETPPDNYRRSVQWRI